MRLIQFLFVVAVPIVVVAGALVTLFLAGAVLNLVDNPQGLQESVLGLFRRPAKEPRATRPDHYYKPYWKEGEKSQG